MSNFKINVIDLYNEIKQTNKIPSNLNLIKEKYGYGRYKAKELMTEALNLILLDFEDFPEDNYIILKQKVKKLLKKQSSNLKTQEVQPDADTKKDDDTSKDAYAEIELTGDYEDDTEKLAEDEEIFKRDDLIELFNHEFHESNQERYVKAVKSLLENLKNDLGFNAIMVKLRYSDEESSNEKHHLIDLNDYKDVNSFIKLMKHPHSYHVDTEYVDSRGYNLSERSSHFKFYKVTSIEYLDTTKRTKKNKTGNRFYYYHTTELDLSNLQIDNHDPTDKNNNSYLYTDHCLKYAIEQAAKLYPEYNINVDDITILHRNYPKAKMSELCKIIQCNIKLYEFNSHKIRCPKCFKYSNIKKFNEKLEELGYDKSEVCLKCFNKEYSIPEEITIKETPNNTDFYVYPHSTKGLVYKNTIELGLFMGHYFINNYGYPKKVITAMIKGEDTRKDADAENAKLVVRSETNLVNNVLNLKMLWDYGYFKPFSNFVDSQDLEKYSNKSYKLTEETIKQSIKPVEEPRESDIEYNKEFAADFETRDILTRKDADARNEGIKMVGDIFCCKNILGGDGYKIYDPEFSPFDKFIDEFIKTEHFGIMRSKCIKFNKKKNKAKKMAYYYAFIMYFHNLKFDVTQVLNSKKLRLYYGLDKNKTSGNPFVEKEGAIYSLRMCMEMNTKDIVDYTYGIHQNVTIIFEFRDSFKLMPYSLNDLCLDILKLDANVLKYPYPYAFDSINRIEADYTQDLNLLKPWDYFDDKDIRSKLKFKSLVKEKGYKNMKDVKIDYCYRDVVLLSECLFKFKNITTELLDKAKRHMEFERIKVLKLKYDEVKKESLKLISEGKNEEGLKKTRFMNYLLNCMSDDFENLLTRTKKLYREIIKEGDDVDEIITQMLDEARFRPFKGSSLTISSMAGSILHLAVTRLPEKVYKVNSHVKGFLSNFVFGGCVTSKHNKLVDVRAEILDNDANSLYPSAIVDEDTFLTFTGEPMLIKDYNHLQDILNDKYSYSFAKIMLNVPFNPKYNYDIGLIRASLEDKINYVNEYKGEYYADKTTLLEILKNYPHATYTFIEGLYYQTDKLNMDCMNAFKSTVKNFLYAERMKYKKMKNGGAYEKLIKLILNSLYGKTILKSVQCKSVYKEFTAKQIKDGDFNDYITENAECLKTIELIRETKKEVYGRKRPLKTFIYRFKYASYLNNSYNLAPFGISILSNSKRIMNNVHRILYNNDIEIYYTDTDSIHHNKYTRKGELAMPIINEEYIKLTRTPFEGKGLGQFSTDFEGNHVSKRMIVTGKKCYIHVFNEENKLRKNKIIEHLTNPMNRCPEIENYYVFRFKGVSKKVIYNYCLEKKISPITLFEDIYNGKIHTVDCAKDFLRLNNKAYNLFKIEKYEKNMSATFLK